MDEKQNEERRITAVVIPGLKKPRRYPPPPEGSGRVWLEGEVDAWATSEDGWSFEPTIGGKDVIGALEEAFPWRAYPHARPAVKVTLGIEQAEGGLFAHGGFTGTDVTPCESAEILVGDWSLLHRLYELDGQTVALLVERD